MPTPNERTVTAQDFLELCCDVDDEFNKLRTKTLILPEFESLLSRARQEAVEEYKASKELKHTVIDEVVKQELIRTRRDALKEMDEAWQFTCFNSPDEDTKTNPVEVLRQEYQTNRSP